jgi:hypothetical protein
MPGLGPLAELLAAGLHRDSARRPTLSKLRSGLSGLAPALRERAWPLAAP